MKLRVIIPALLIVLIVAFSACKKYNQIDNSGTVKTPYSLFIGGFYGTLHKTNEGLYFNTLFPTDNSTVRQIIIADSNILYLKDTLYCSTDDGRSFQYASLNAIGFINKFYKYYFPNTCVYDPTDRKVYLCVKNGGLEVSTDLGKTFAPETAWQDPFPVGKRPTSITRLDNGKLFVMIDSIELFKKDPGAQWVRIAADGTNDLPKDTTTWYVSKSHDTLYAIDYSGKFGVHYSVNDGADWTAVPGVPKKNKLLFAHEAAHTGNFYLGIDSGGLYRIDGSSGSFTSVGAGFPWFAKVSFVEGKFIRYRTDVVRHYLFCSTDQGLYISETNGNDWKKIRDGSYSTLR